MNKKELRTKYKALRKNLSLSEIEEMSLKIANNVLRLPIWDKNNFHVHLPITEHNEVNTEYILHILFGKDKNCIVSKSDFKSLTMTHFLLTDATKIKKNDFNIPEPVDGIEVPVSKIEVVFVPLLAYDKEGNRVGYGKGFYDTFLTQCQAETIKIGLSFFEPENKIEDAYEKDIKIDYCITATTIYKLP